MTLGSRTRLKLLLGLSSSLLLLLLARGAYLTLFQHPEISTFVHRQQTDPIEEPGVRGPILDRTGRTLACTLENPSVAVRLNKESDQRRLLGSLVEAGVCSEERSRKVARSGGRGFFWLYRSWISSDVLDRVPTTWHEVEIVPEAKRFYPSGIVAPALVGIVGQEGHGLSGLEWRYDKWLSGRPGRTLQFVTGGGYLDNAPPPMILEEPEPGGGLQLTIDSRMQMIARHRLREGMQRVEALTGFVILMDPWTGEVLAMCEEPSFDPLDDASVVTEQLKAHPVSDQYEPGSTFKVVPFIAALEAGVISPDDTLDCGPGERMLGGCRIRDHRAFGVVSAREAFSHSSNIGAGRIAERAGWVACYRTAQALGFGVPTGIDLAGEAPGFLPHPLQDNWSQRSLVTVAYGQEVSCTGLQMALAYGAIANGGVLMKPLLVKAALDGEGRVVQRFEPQAVRRAMSPETAQTMIRLMRAVVTDGTGRAAEIPWFRPAGKTGTAQIFDQRRNAYAKDEHILSFVGFAPCSNPRILCQVCLLCKGDLHASDVAVPIFTEIIKDLVWILQEGNWDLAAVTKTKNVRVAVPDVRGLEPQAARQALQRLGLIAVLEGRGGSVQRVQPQPYRMLKRGAIVHLSLGGEIRRNRVSVPDVCGLSLRRAASLLTEAGLSVGVRGTGWVVRQDLPPGSEVEPGALCVASGSSEASHARLDAVQRREHARLDAVLRRELACQTR